MYTFGRLGNNQADGDNSVLEIFARIKIYIKVFEVFRVRDVLISKPITWLGVSTFNNRQASTESLTAPSAEDNKVQSHTLEIN